MQLAEHPTERGWLPRELGWPRDRRTQQSERENSELKSHWSPPTTGRGKSAARAGRGLYARQVLADAYGPAWAERDCGRAKLLLECRHTASLQTRPPARCRTRGKTGSADGLRAALDEREASTNATWRSMRSDQRTQRK